MRTDVVRLGRLSGERTGDMMKFLSSMLPEVALVKQMWVLGNEKDPEKAAAMMATDLKGEYMRRSGHGL